MLLRAVIATCAGVVVGVAVDFGVNALVVGSPPRGFGSMQSLTGPWGVVFGFTLGLLSAFVTFYLRLPDRARRNVWAAVAALCIAVGLVVSTSAFSYGVPGLTTLEGAWIYPTLTFFFGFGTFAVIKARRAT
jgi:uncharacterized BrkB/YihY/UPF0761 family membrane protein